MSRAEKVAAFRALHEGEGFVIPNPWDAGSARVLAGLGFEALATTSSGFAFTLGRNDGDVTLDEAIEHAAAIDAATTLPVSVDLENGYGDEPAGAARAVEAAAVAGAAGGSIEDYAPRGPLSGIYERGLAVERVAAGAQRISVGGALAFTAVAALAEAATAIREEGSFAGHRWPPRELGDWLS